MTPSFPALPDRLKDLGDLASDIWWSWHYRARDLFRRIDYPLWRVTEHNPVRVLRTVAPERLEQMSKDRAFLALYDDMIRALRTARDGRETWWARTYPEQRGHTIAYFSAEFALHHSLPIYAGGLGVLAGDICKEASDLGLSFVGVGFMYPQGYFHQKLSADGWQMETYEHLDWEYAPIEGATRPDGSRCVVSVPLGNRTVKAAIWRVKVGAARIFLLDTDLEENAPWDRELSARLYGGNHEMRVQQEIVLGLGGVHALEELGIAPSVWHLNEGHAAFVAMPRIKALVDAGAAFDDAVVEVKRSTVFTTHTPVPAGHDAFPFHLVEQHLADALGTLGEHRDRFLALGSFDNGSGVQFNMTALAMRTSGGINAVSKLHGSVTKDMWASVWSDTPRRSLPIRAITNGIHTRTWLAATMAKVFDDFLGPEWRERLDDVEYWDRVLDIPDEALWKARQSMRTELFRFIRERASARWTHEQLNATQVVAAGTLLDPNALTIGFARRFTGYKRPELILHNPERLAAILSAFRRPVQIIFAGKAHPADDVGKHHLQHVFRKAVDPVFGGRIAFLDDYSLHVARFMVQGCDIWLNNPRKPMEASGTSGMKAAVNGVPHLSVGDGWWAEGFTGANGWLIEGHAPSQDYQAVDAADAESLYRLLEQEIVPAFYDRDALDVPVKWLKTVKESIRTVLPVYSTRRMMKEYVQGMYLQAVGDRRQALGEGIRDQATPRLRSGQAGDREKGAGIRDQAAGGGLADRDEAV